MVINIGLWVTMHSDHCWPQTVTAFQAARRAPGRLTNSSPRRLGSERVACMDDHWSVGDRAPITCDEAAAIRIANDGDDITRQFR